MSEILIPKVFHRIWLGGNPMPERFVHYGETWQNYHPDWEINLWTESNLPKLRNRWIFDDAPTESEKSDVLRYELMWQFGGVYLDTDFECLRSVAPLLEDVTAFVAKEREEGDTIGSGFIGGIPGHSFYDDAIRSLPRHYQENPGYSAPMKVGNQYLTQIVKGRTDVTIFPWQWFYPYGWDETHRRNESFPDAYAVHHWTFSWLKWES